MKRLNFFIAALSMIVLACNNNASVESEHDHENEEVKFHYTQYTNELEYYAEADPFVLGEESNILSHFTWLSNFKPLKNATVTVKLNVGGTEVTQKLQADDHVGIYSFNIEPKTAGSGTLSYDIQTGDNLYQVLVPNVNVFQNDEEAHADAEAAEVSAVNSSMFTKEQSWKIDFRTELPARIPFGQVIKTVAQVKSTPLDETTLTAKSNGSVQFLNNNLVEGRAVSANEKLFSISGNQLAVNNSAVMYAEAKNNYETSKLDYERKLELARDKIVSEKELLDARNKFENAKIIFQNLENNFNDQGEVVKSPFSGFVKNVFVQNGDYTEPGQALVTIVRNRKYLLHAEIQPKFKALMSHFSGAVIKTMGTRRTYDFSKIDGELLAIGNSAAEGNFMIPVHLRTNAVEDFIPGDFVELYLKTSEGANKLVVPNSALLEEQGYFFVYVQLSPEMFEKREVKTGETDGLQTEIVEGISPDERIVTQGAMFIKLSQATGALDPHAGHVH